MLFCRRTTRQSNGPAYRRTGSNSDWEINSTSVSDNSAKLYLLFAERWTVLGELRKVLQFGQKSDVSTCSFEFLPKKKGYSWLCEWYSINIEFARNDKEISLDLRSDACAVVMGTPPGSNLAAARYFATAVPVVACLARHTSHRGAELPQVARYGGPVVWPRHGCIG